MVEREESKTITKLNKREGSTAFTETEVKKEDALGKM